MRISRVAVAVTMTLLIAAVGRTNQVTGTAKQDLGQPPLEVSKDGYGDRRWRSGTPRCRSSSSPSWGAISCAELEDDHGDETWATSTSANWW